VSWTVRLHDIFEKEFESLPQEVQDEMLAMAKLLKDYGPRLGRPHADTLNGSAYANMKELRFQAADGVWRVAFAFDPQREAILLCAGDKSGGSEEKFYKRLLKKADERYRQHFQNLQSLIAQREKRGK
jgi:hypothetical protein